MKKNIVLLFGLILVLVSCSSTHKVKGRRCYSILKNDYKSILKDKFKSVVGNDTLVLNEVKYECVHSSFYTQKAMYDKFGKWNKELYPNGRVHPILLWENVKLFPNDTTEFDVAATGLESVRTIYASVIVFDQKDHDLLSENSDYKKKLIEYFSNLIRSNNLKKEDFHEIYWKTVDPERWKIIKEYQNK